MSAFSHEIMVPQQERAQTVQGTVTMQFEFRLGPSEEGVGVAPA